jgi:hypothetical protein
MRAFTLTKPSKVEVKLYDALGKILSSSNAFYDSGRNISTLHLNDMPSGWYVYEIVVDGVAERYRFIKEK